MSENKAQSTMLDDEHKQRAEEKVADKLSMQYKVTMDVNSCIARNEAMNIVVAIINAFLSERQKGDNKLTDAELKAIQNAVAVENAKTDKLFKEVDAIMKGNIKDKE